MTKTAPGTKENPGKNVKTKKALNRAILKQGWHRFQTFLEYKTIWYESKLGYVAPEYTSQKCYQCGNIDQENRKTQKQFKCIVCGHTDNANINAAKNIYTDGLSSRARVELRH